MFGADVADATCQHDGLVVATHLDAVVARHLLFEGTEVTQDGRATEFVVEGGAAKGPFLHDVKGTDDAARLAEVLLPGLLETGDAQVGDGEAHQARLGFGATACRTLVADFAAGAGGGTREGRDGGRVVVGLHLHQDVDALLMIVILTAGGAWEEAATLAPFHHGGVVFIGREDMIRRLLEGVLDHLEQRLGLLFAVDGPVGVEDLVTAVLGVRLGKHVELDVVGIATQPGEVGHQVIYFVIGQGQTQGHVGLFQGGATTTQHIYLGKGARLVVSKQGGGLVHLGKDHFHHAIVQQGRDLATLGHAQLTLGLHVIGNAALQPLDLFQAAVVGDVGCFGRPGGDSAGAGGNEEQLTAGGVFRDGRAVAQKLAQGRSLGGRQRARQLGKMHVFRIDACYLYSSLCAALQQLVDTKLRQCWGTTQDFHIPFSPSFRVWGDLRRAYYRDQAHPEQTFFSSRAV